MITDQEGAIVSLLNSQNIKIIKDLFDMSYFTSEMLMSSLNKYCATNINPDVRFVNEIINLIENHFGQEILYKNKLVLNSLLSNMTREYKDNDFFSACFIKLTNLGGVLNDDIKSVSYTHLTLPTNREV